MDAKRDALASVVVGKTEDAKEAFCDVWRSRPTVDFTATVLALLYFTLSLSWNINRTRRGDVYTLVGI